jgi:hypothetical protein
MTFASKKWWLTLALAFLPGFGGLEAAEAPPSFKEVYDLLKANLVNTDEEGLERAAVSGMLRQLAPLAVLVTNGQPMIAPSSEPALAKTAVFDGVFGYLRLARVEPGLPKEVSSAMQALSTSNQIQGWVLDLRFANGPDYSTAAALADRFVATEQPLLDFGQGTVKSKAKDNAIKGPVTVLINHSTCRAAEALAAILRRTEAALLLGTNTAGQGFITKDFPLKNGQALRVAHGTIQVGAGEPLTAQGVKPDILVAVRAEEERAYLEDPYRVLARPPLAGPWSLSLPSLATSPTNKAPRHRINEAELVRILREGLDYDEEGLAARTVEPARPVVRDPVLARALDLLKGLAVVQRLK